MKHHFVHISLAKASYMGKPVFNRMGLFTTWTQKDRIPTMAHSSLQVDRVKFFCLKGICSEVDGKHVVKWGDRK